MVKHSSVIGVDAGSNPVVLDLFVLIMSIIIHSFLNLTAWLDN
jgi:hypothetical protein